MKKGYFLAGSSGNRLFIDQGRAMCPGLLKLSFYVVAEVGNVMESLAPLFEKSGKGTCRIRWFKQLNMGFAQGEERSAHLLGGDLLYPFAV